MLDDAADAARGASGAEGARLRVRRRAGGRHRPSRGGGPGHALGTPRAVVNNAGIVRRGRAWATSPVDWDRCPRRQPARSVPCVARRLPPVHARTPGAMASLRAWPASPRRIASPAARPRHAAARQGGASCGPRRASRRSCAGRRASSRSRSCCRARSTPACSPGSGFAPRMTAGGVAEARSSTPRSPTRPTPSRGSAVEMIG